MRLREFKKEEKNTVKRNNINRFRSKVTFLTGGFILKKNEAITTTVTIIALKTFANSILSRIDKVGETSEIIPTKNITINCSALELGIFFPLFITAFKIFRL